ncbi:MAG TPA: hypothetical protein VJ385_19715, partial [Fibrobacteria bacterium]|nr:hypothetical protein [Fibrobacteria bacterium]
KERYLKQQEYARHHDALGRPLKDSTLEKGKPEPKPAKEKPARSSTWVWWAGSAVGVAAVATTAVLLLHEDSKSSNASDPLQP